MILGAKRSVSFQFIIDRIGKKLSGWKEKLLSIATTKVLIKSVIQVIPTYTMQCFWWGRDEKRKCMCWKSWDELCRPKNEGGLGFRNSHHFNKALLAKQSWRIIHNPQSLVAQVLHAKYYPSSSFL